MYTKMVVGTDIPELNSARQLYLFRFYDIPGDTS